jgi:hypothetical protein
MAPTSDAETIQTPESAGRVARTMSGNLRQLAQPVDDRALARQDLPPEWVFQPLEAARFVYNLWL